MKCRLCSFLWDFFYFSAIIVPIIIVVIIIVVVVVIIIKKSKYDSMTKIKKIYSFSFKIVFLVSKFNVSVTLDNGCLSTEFLGTALVFHCYFSSRDNELVFVCLFVCCCFFFWYFFLANYKKPYNYGFPVLSYPLLWLLYLWFLKYFISAQFLYL